MKSALLLAALLTLAWPALAKIDGTDDAAKEAEAKTKVEQWIAGLKFETGTVSIGSGLATATLPPEFKYLNGSDSSRLLTLFGNPPQKNLGTIFPAKTDLLRDENAWFIVMQYDEDGYVKDDDAEKINYTDLLKQMQTSISESNEERAKEGYSSLKLIGWATPPRYDRGSHKMFWAKEIKFGDSPENTLNYNIRMLGRKGVLVLNAVAGMNKLAEIEAATPQILSMVDFNAGNRYTDFNGSTDKVATYGIAALVAGGVAAKAGLFKVAGIFLLKFWKVILIGIAAVGGFVKKIFTRKEQ
jgi:uncharacterized membrane-anchored protein